MDVPVNAAPASLSPQPTTQVNNAPASANDAPKASLAQIAQAAEGKKGTASLARDSAVTKQDVSNPEDIPEWRRKDFKHKLTVDGQEQEVDYDELIKGYSHNKAANQRMQKAAELQRTYESDQKKWMEENTTRISSAEQMTKLLMNLKNEPASMFEFAEALGIDIMELAEPKLIDKFRRSAMPENERRLLEYEEKFAKIEADTKRQAEFQKQQQEKAMQAQHAEATLTEFQSVFEGKNASPELIELTLQQKMLDDSLTFEQAYKRANRFLSARPNKVTSADEVPEDLQEQIAKAKFEKAKANRYKPTFAPNQSNQQQVAEPKSSADWFKEMDAKTRPQRR
jgi:hypothetical protein